MEIVHKTESNPKKSMASECRTIANTINIAGFAMNYYRLEPGDSFSTSFHTHLDQEEIFHILNGVATFRTEDGTISVSEGEIVRFAPGEFQHGFNDTDNPIHAMVFAAPKEGSESRIECPSCGMRGPPRISIVDDGRVRLFECRECDAEVARQT